MVRYLFRRGIILINVLSLLIEGIFYHTETVKGNLYNHQLKIHSEKTYLGLPSLLSIILTAELKGKVVFAFRYLLG